jgi:predicted Zn-dependent protease
VPASTPIDPAAIDQAAALLAADPASAAARAGALLQAAPGDPRLVLILASAQRRLGRHGEARGLLEPLAQAWPRAALTQYEYGMVLVALGERSAGGEALRRAVEANRDLAEAWRALGDLLFEDGDAAGAAAAYAEHGRAAVRDPRLKPAAEALFNGRLDQAEGMLRALLTAEPNDALALQMLAEALMRQGGHGQAEVLLAHALQLDPDFDGARFSYASALFHQQKAEAALPQLERLLRSDPDNAAYRNLLAGTLCLVGEYGPADQLYQDLLAQFPGQAPIWLNYGHALRTVGRGPEAMAAYQRCIALDPGLGDAYWSLANLKVASFTAAEVEAMRNQLQQPQLSPENRLHLHYALGKALEDQGDYAQSFANYAAGAALRKAAVPYDPEAVSAHVRRSKALYTEAFFAARQGAGSPAPDPIFILGLPRSGSTLAEQILASHSQVEGTMELPDLGFLAQGLGWPDEAYPGRLAQLSTEQLTALGERYLQTTRIHRKQGRPLFIDKMPNNFLHLGLIALMLPGAKIIDARRHPLGTGFSAFKQHFAQGQAFSYDLTDLGRYYADYCELMAHIDAVLPGRVHRVIYEDMVADTEGEVRRLLGHCGLPFEAGCLDFHRNTRAVRTVSSEQVRRPIFREGLEQWRHYEPWLGPLKAALGPWLEGWRG